LHQVIFRAVNVRHGVAGIAEKDINIISYWARRRTGLMAYGAGCWELVPALGQAKAPELGAGAGVGVGTWRWRWIRLGAGRWSWIGNLAPALELEIGTWALVLASDPGLGVPASGQDRAAGAGDGLWRRWPAPGAGSWILVIGAGEGAA